VGSSSTTVWYAVPGTCVRGKCVPGTMHRTPQQVYILLFFLNYCTDVCTHTCTYDTCVHVAVYFLMCT
jgi:hypothetical protein